MPASGIHADGVRRKDIDKENDMEKKKINLEYTELKEGENLYDDCDLSAKEIVEARYIRDSWGDDNPDLCALPRKPTNSEMIDLASIVLPGYRRDALPNMSDNMKRDQIVRMQNVFVPLYHHIELVEHIDQLLRFSYRNRSQYYSETYSGTKLIRDDGKATMISRRELISPSPEGFSMLGESGTGKSDGIRLVMSVYPRAIRHRFGDIEYIQVPIIYVSALVSNLSGIYKDIGAWLDEVLDTGSIHEDMVKNSQPGKCACIIKKWIKTYHIGMIIIDEVQFLPVDNSKSSFENIISIMEGTGCVFGIVGNLEAMEKIKKMGRIVRRTANHRIDIEVIADEAQAAFFQNAVDELWDYQWTAEEAVLDDDLRGALLNECAYNIALLKILLCKTQLYLVRHKKEHITGDLLRKIAGPAFEEMRTLIDNGDRESDRSLHERIADTWDRMGMEAEGDEKKKAAVEALRESIMEKDYRQKEMRVTEVLLTATDYTETQIRRAIRAVVNSSRSMKVRPDRDLARAARERLDRYNRKQERSLKAVPKERDDRVLTEEAEAAVKELVNRKDAV